MTTTVGEDHARVTEEEAGRSIEGALEYHRHLFAYAEAGRRITAGAKVLEVGSGGGYGAAYLARQGFDVSAVEPSAQAVEYSRERFPDVRYQVASGTELPFKRVFDAIVSFQVIEHVEDVPRYLREMARVLRPGGSVFITTPNRQLRLFPFQKPWNPYHLREYSARTLHDAVAAVFPASEVRGVYGNPLVMRTEIRRVRRMKLGLVGIALGLLPGSRRLRQLRELARPSAVSIAQQDFFLAPRTDRCLDLFAMATA